VPLTGVINYIFCIYTYNTEFYYTLAAISKGAKTTTVPLPLCQLCRKLIQHGNNT